MLKWLRDVVFAPVLIAFGFMIWGAWYTGVKFHSPFSLSWMRIVLTAPIPLWFSLPFFIGGPLIGWFLFRLSRRNRFLEAQDRQLSLNQTAQTYLVSENQRLRAKLDSEEPRVHVSWQAHTEYWSLLKVYGEVYMSLFGQITFCTSNTKETISLNRAYLPGTAKGTIMLTKIAPEELVHDRFHVILRPVQGVIGEIFEGQVIFVDTKGREYVSERAAFSYKEPPLSSHPQSPSQDEVDRYRRT